MPGKRPPGKALGLFFGAANAVSVAVPKAGTVPRTDPGIDDLGNFPECGECSAYYRYFCRKEPWKAFEYMRCVVTRQLREKRIVRVEHGK